VNNGDGGGVAGRRLADSRQDKGSVGGYGLAGSGVGSITGYRLAGSRVEEGSVSGYKLASSRGRGSDAGCKWMEARASPVGSQVGGGRRLKRWVTKPARLIARVSLSRDAEAPLEVRHEFRLGGRVTALGQVSFEGLAAVRVMVSSAGAIPPVVRRSDVGRGWRAECAVRAGIVGPHIFGTSSGLPYSSSGEAIIIGSGFGGSFTSSGSAELVQVFEVS
jgi:hypothetical protein